MDSLYTEEIRNILVNAPWPRRLQWDVYERRDRLILAFYTDNFKTLTPAELDQVGQIVSDVILPIRAKGVPIEVRRRETRQ